MTVAAVKAPVVALNPQQQEAVGCERSVLVLSGAGTGKTRVIVERVRRLLDQGVPPREILAITYTNKAALEMRTRIGDDAKRMWACTFHSFGIQLLVRHPEESGLGRGFLILDDDDQRQMVRRVLIEDMGLPKEKEGGPKPKDVQRYIVSKKEQGLRPEDVRYSPDQYSLDAFFRYEERRREQSKADFAELLLRTRELLENDPDIRAKWSGRFKYILIDELQDINKLQFKILSLLRREGTVYFGVGDDDQSIYRFRGAQPKMVERFVNEFVGGEVIRLERNYRSTENILHLANDIIGQNSNRLGKKLHGELGAGTLPELTRYMTDEDEARSVARTIARMRDHGVPLSDICILYRNNVLSQLLETHLRGAGLHFRIYGGQQYFARAEVKDAVAYLMAAANPNDIDAVARSVNKPIRGFGGKSQERLADAVQTGRTLLEILDGSSHPGARNYVSIIARIRKHAEARDVKGAVNEAVYGSGLHEHLVSHREQERADNLEELINIAARYVRDAETPSLVDFLRLAAIDQEKDDDDAKEKITLMTIHRAKGLEFKRVFLIGLEQMIIPGVEDDNDTIAEERRLLYVAVTRAQLELRMSHTAMRRRRGTMTPSSLTMLLHTINPELVREVNGHSLNRGNSNPKAHLLRRKSDHEQEPGKKELGGFVVGDIVRSTEFSNGVVLEFEGEGEHAKALVLFFRENKKRWVVLNQAALSLTTRR